MQVNQKPQDSLYRAAAAPTIRTEGGSGFEQRTAPEDEPPKTRETTTRDLRVTEEDIERFGATDFGCQRCDFYSTNRTTRGCPYAHSRHCRERIKRRLAESEEGLVRLRKVEERLQRRDPGSKATTTSLDDIHAKDSGLRTPTADELATPVHTDDEKEEDDDLLEEVQDEEMGLGDNPDSIAATSPAQDDVIVHSPSEDSDVGNSMATVMERSSKTDTVTCCKPLAMCNSSPTNDCPSPAEEDDSPLKQLFTFPAEISQGAVRYKDIRHGPEDMRKVFENKELYDAMISSLPDSAISELAHEMVGLCVQAEFSWSHSCGSS